MNRSHPFRRFGVSGIAALSLAGTASALPPEADRWHEVSTPHFRFLSNGPEKETLAMAERLERMGQALQQLTPGLTLGASRPVEVFFFRDASSFRPYARIHAGTDLRQPAGFYRAAEYRDVLALLPPKADADFNEHATAAYLDDLLRRSLPRAPVWLLRGLSMLYGTARPVKTGIEVGRPVAIFIEPLRAKRMPCEALFAMKPGYEPGGDPSDFTPWTQSWALANWLLVDDEGRRAKTAAFIQAVARGEPAAAAFARTVGLSCAEIDAALAAFVSQKTFNFFTVRFNAPVDTGSPRVLARHEILVALGWLLASLDPVNATEAEAHFRAALASQPTAAAAHTGIAWLRARDRRYDDAATEFERAIAEGATDPLVLLLAARNLLARAASIRGGTPGTRSAIDDAAQARHLLERALVSTPDHPETLASLGATYTFGGADPSPGIAALVKAIPMLPPRSDALLNLVTLHALNRDRASAKAVVDGPLKEFGEPAAIATARERIALADFADVNTKLAENDLDGALEILRTGRESAASNTLRARYDAEIARIEPVAKRNRTIAKFNAAAALANKGDWKGAATLCEALLSEDPDEEYRARTEELLVLARKAGVKPRR